MKKRKQSAGKKARDLMALGLGTGFSSQLLGSAGSVHGQQAMGKISGKMPMMGSMVGAGMVMDSVGMMKKKADKMYK